MKQTLQTINELLADKGISEIKEAEAREWHESRFHYCTNKQLNISFKKR